MLLAGSHPLWQCQNPSVLLASATDGAGDTSCLLSLVHPCRVQRLLVPCKGESSRRLRARLPAGGHRHAPLSSPRRFCATTWLSWASEARTIPSLSHPLPADQDPWQGPRLDPGVAECLCLPSTKGTQRARSWLACRCRTGRALCAERSHPALQAHLSHTG